MKNKNYNKIQKERKSLTNLPANKLTTSRGFTLLFASLIGALVLAVGLAILSIALKQLQLSSSGRESQKAFFSADAGVECALFLDRGGVDTDCRLGVFATPSTTPTGGSDGSMVACGVPYGNNEPHIYECFGKKVTLSLSEDGADFNPAYVISHFDLDNGSSGDGGGDNYGMCFGVDVKKIIDDPSTNDVDESSTIIESRGYNNCTADTANRYERAIRVKNF